MFLYLKLFNDFQITEMLTSLNTIAKKGMEKLVDWEQEHLESWKTRN